MKNLIVLLADDQRFDTIRALGNRAISTPNLDRLVSNGVAFTHCHVMGATRGAVSIASRAMLMTGRNLFHLVDGAGIIPRDHTTLPETLKNLGYRTCGIGKWHNDRASYARSFTEGGPILFGAMDDHFKTRVHSFDPSGLYPDEQSRIGEKHSSEMFADAAVKFIERRSSSNPFALYAAFTAPHDPRVVPEKYKGLYDPEKIEIPPNFMPEHPFDNGELKSRDEMLAPFPRTPEAISKHIADYYAIITHLDAQIGRIMTALKKAGLVEETLIVFASDSGLALGRHGLMGKQNLYQHSVRVPLIVSGAGIPRGERRGEMCYLHDIFPTVCDYLGIQAPQTVESVNLMPVIREPERIIRDTVFHAYRDLQRAVSDGRWKLIEYRAAGKRHTQLFDLVKDPYEMNDLADDSRRASEIRRLRREMTVWQIKTDDPQKSILPEYQ